jgi:hypothetical protein
MSAMPSVVIRFKMHLALHENQFFANFLILRLNWPIGFSSQAKGSGVVINN